MHPEHLCHLLLETFVLTLKAMGCRRGRRGEEGDSKHVKDLHTHTHTFTLGTHTQGPGGSTAGHINKINIGTHYHIYNECSPHTYICTWKVCNTNIDRS